MLRYLLINTVKDDRDGEGRDTYKIDTIKFRSLLDLCIIVGGDNVSNMFYKYGFMDGVGTLNKSKNRERGIVDDETCDTFGRHSFMQNFVPRTFT